MSAPGLRCSGLRLQLGGRPVLDGIDLTVAPGEFVALLGPSGCGKSTLLRVVAGLTVPDAGSVDPIPRPGSAALMPQDDCLLPWRSLLGNVALGPELAGLPEPRAAALRGLRAFGLDAFAAAYPAELSGGMRQRAALLRTVLARKPLLLLDEPLGALDSLTRLELQDWLEQLWLQGPDAAAPEVGAGSARPSVLLVTHDVGEAVRLADRIAVLSARPARVTALVAVPAARPRPPRFRTSAEAVGLQARLLGLLGAGASA